MGWTERFDLEVVEALQESKFALDKFSPAAKLHLRSRIILSVIAALWKEAFDRLHGLPIAQGWRAEVEQCFLEWIPEIRQDERFDWALEETLQVYKNHTLPLKAALTRSFKRLRTENRREKPIKTRAYVTGAPLLPTGGL